MNHTEIAELQSQMHGGEYWEPNSDEAMMDAPSRQQTLMSLRPTSVHMAQSLISISLDTTRSVLLCVNDASMLCLCCQTCRGLWSLADADALWRPLLRPPALKLCAGMNLGCKASYKLRELSLRQPGPRPVPESATYVFSVEIELKQNAGSKLIFESSHEMNFTRPPGVDRWCHTAWDECTELAIELPVDCGSVPQSQLGNVQVTVMISQPSAGKMTCLLNQGESLTRGYNSEGQCTSLDFPSEFYRCDIQDTSPQCDITGGFCWFVSCDLDVTFTLGEDIDWDDVGEEDENEYTITCIRLWPSKMDAGTSTFDDIDHTGYLWHALETAPLNWVRVSTS